MSISRAKLKEIIKEAIEDLTQEKTVEDAARKLGYESAYWLLLDLASRIDDIEGGN